MNPLFLFCKRLSPVRKLLLMHLAAGGKLIEYTETGNPLSFVTNVAKNLTQLLIPWTPTQSGTGDPSPTNVRPISGVSGVNITRCGANLFDKDAVTHGYYIKSDGTVVQTAPGYDWCITDYIPVIGNGKITYKSIGSTGTAPYSAWYTADKTLISTFKQQGGTSAAYTTTAPSTAKYVRFSILNIDTNLVNFIVALGESIGDYVAYTGNTVSVVFPDEVGTVYGGSLDLTTGVLKVTDANIASYAGETLPSTWISDRDVYAVGTTPTTGAQVVYKLATPVTYQLTPEQIETLIGTNTIWTDTNGTNTAKYLKKG